MPWGCSQGADGPTASGTRSGFSRRLVRCGGDERLTDALAVWTSKLWPVGASQPGSLPPADLTWMGTASPSLAII